MELILGIQPMTQHDREAVTMWRCFQNVPDCTPYVCRPEKVNLDDKNVKNDKLAQMCKKYNFKKEDAVPDVEFNQVLWKGLKGSVPYQSIHRPAFVSYSLDDDD